MRQVIMALVVTLVAAGSAVAAPVQVTFDVEGLGSFTVELHDNTPLHRDNFVNYVTAGLYADTIFHRSDSGNHVIQSGGYLHSTDPQYVVEDVPTLFGNVPYEGDVADSNVMMTLGAARSTDPDSANSQWYINMADNSGWFDHQPGVPGYTVFGHVVDGWDVLLAIYGLDVWIFSGAFTAVPLHDSYTQADYDSMMLPERDDFVTISGATIVPEPATLALLAAGALALVRRKR